MDQPDISHPIDLTLPGLSHDLAQTMTAAKGWVQFLERCLSRDQVSADERVRQALAAIDTAMTHMQLLLEETLDHARHAATQPLLTERQPTDLVQLARALYREKTRSIDDICKMLDISRATLCRYIKAEPSEHGQTDGPMREMAGV